jgi:hypothetical protein
MSLLDVRNKVVGSYKNSNLYRERMKDVEERKCFRPEGILIPVPNYPKYLFCPSQDQLYSTKMAGIDYYALKRQPASEWNDFRDHFQITENGVKHTMTLDYLKTLKADTEMRDEVEMSAINNNYTTNPQDYKGKFLVGSIQKATGFFSMTSNPARHATREFARAEAARLAKIDSSKMFVVLNVQDIASFQDIVWA